ncbi:alpha/beta hydrolase [Micromonospora andamanensis]|uniref:Esterase n=1 Tax=Micromonospora andamanensis TaxID=1287068 RepID=A0ABQ4I1I1_9ACTN|nr:alpha/beta hydrolase [Micromonospora andamanensis]GIJ11646.1 esterase [Micromonospora andamanensis]
MPNDYLVHVLVLGLATTAALTPPARPRPLARAAFLAGMVVNEVPHLVLTLLALSTVAAVWSGDLRRDVWSGVLLAGATATGVMLIALTRRATRSRSAAGAALRAAGIDRAPARRSLWRTALTPLPFRPHSVQRLRNLRYGDHRRQRLDVLRRRDRPASGPVLVYFHGGGYFSGSKNWEGRGLLHHLAERGWLCVSATYRLRPGAGFEEHLADATAAMAWARTHAAEYGADASTVVMAGSSAGAHLTSLYALRATPDERPAAAVCLYGYYGRYYGRSAEETVASTPFALPASDAPAFLIAHGTLDNYTPAAAARALADKLRAESSQPVVHVELPGGQHAFDLVRSWRLTAVIDALDVLLADIDVGAGNIPAAGAADHPDRRPTR